VESFLDSALKRQQTENGSERQLLGKEGKLQQSWKRSASFFALRSQWRLVNRYSPYHRRMEPEPEEAPPTAVPPILRSFLYLNGRYLFEVHLREGFIDWNSATVRCEWSFGQQDNGQQVLTLRFHWNNNWERARVTNYCLLYSRNNLRVWRDENAQFLLEF
jgi:hypothetical protein